MPVDLHVIVETDARFAPLGIFVGLRRQGLQRRLVQRFELRTTRARQLLEGTFVEGREQLTNRQVQFEERVKSTVPQPRRDSTLNYLYRHFHFGFVARLVRPYRQRCVP